MATLQSGKKYWIAYRNAEGEESERVIHVRSVTPGAYGRTYIRAFCELAGEERTFRLDRMVDIELLDGPRSEETEVTQQRNSSYRSPAVAAAAAQSRATPAARDDVSSSAPTRNAEGTNFGGLGRFLLKAAAIFILFDFVITDDPGRMSGHIVEAVETMVDPHPGLNPPEALTDYSEDAEPRPAPAPTPSPKPVTVALPAETQEARKAIRIERLARKSEVTHELVISRYDRADLDHDDELSWRELRKFQEAVFRDFRYESNGKALRPDEFFMTGGGDCEDFAIFSAAMLTYWGWDAYVASMGTSDNDAHAVVFIKVDRPPSWASFYEIPGGTGNPRLAASGTFVPVDYDVVGGLSNAVTPGSTVTDIVVPREWYGLAI